MSKKKPPKLNLCAEIEQAIQNPSEAASLELFKYLRFYLKKYPEIVKQLVPPELMTLCEEVFRSLAEETPALPSDADIGVVRSFYMTWIGKMKTSNDSARTWLKEQTSSPQYCYPFYYSSCWLTVADLEANKKLQLIAEFHKKMIVWLHDIGAEQLLFEGPLNVPPGICLLVHSIADIKLITPTLPATAPNSTPSQSLVADHSKVDDALFTKIIVELLPQMASCLGNKEMFRYWKNSLLDRAIHFCIVRYNICLAVQTFKTKVEVVTYFNQLKVHFETLEPLTILSQDYVRVIERLAPLLPTIFVDNWRDENAKCCRFLEQLSATEYLTAKALPFLGDGSIFQEQLENEMKEQVNLFKRLEEASDEQFLEKFQNDVIIKKHKGKPFWFARELEGLCIGYGVSFLQKRKKEFTRYFNAIKKRLQRLKQESLLQEAAPPRNFYTLKLLGISDDIINKLKTMN
jgi:hypothetical protein